MNNVTISGRFTKDPELKVTQAGKKWTRFTIAVPAPKANDKDADFIRCVAWDGIADFICTNFCKGKKIEIQGELHSNERSDENGERHSTIEVFCEKAYFGEKKQKEDTEIEG